MVSIILAKMDNLAANNLENGEMETPMDMFTSSSINAQVIHVYDEICDDTIRSHDQNGEVTFPDNLETDGKSETVEDTKSGKKVCSRGC